MERTHTGPIPGGLSLPHASRSSAPAFFGVPLLQAFLLGGSCGFPDLGGSKLNRRGKPQVLDHVSTYQGKPFRHRFFEPRPFRPHVRSPSISSTRAFWTSASPPCSAFASSTAVEKLNQGKPTGNGVGSETSSFFRLSFF